MKIAVLGPKGTFCDKACREFEKKIQKVKNETLTPCYFTTIDDVFEAVCREEDACEYGIVPVENLLDGYVQRTLDLLLEQPVHIVHENHVPVQFALMGNAKSKEEIQKIYVQFKANGQCRQFLNSLRDVSVFPTESNMESYYKLGEEIGAAAIVPQHITEMEPEKVILDNVTDAGENSTRFFVFRRGALDMDNPDGSAEVKKLLHEDDFSDKGDEASEEKLRIPVYIMPATDRPGILFDILRRFYENRINLISIMSRPTKQALGTYNFYIEIDCLAKRLDIILETIRQIQVYNDIKILGIYKE